MAFSFLVFGYFFGSIPTGYLITKYFFRKDIRQYYSKNIGATNVARVLGWKIGIIVLILDFLKAYLPSLVVLNILGYKDPFKINTSLALSAIVGIGAVFGHLNPYLLEFKGGKGVASFFGAISALNLKIALAGAIVWIIAFLLFKIPAIASLASVAVMSVNFFLPFMWEQHLIPAGLEKIRMLFVLVAWLIFIRHIDNIIRIAGKKEYKL
ncbi:MAG: glycerol-3-phosphate 1-O-acyltransferase PlsY [Planctomycetota bacterium]